MFIDGTMDGLIEIFVFFGVLYYFFNTRATNMVDVLFMRLHEVYEKWDNKTDVRRNSGTGSSGASSPFSAGDLRRAGREYRRRRDFECSSNIKFSNLYEAKIKKDSSVYYKSLRMFIQPYCSHCIKPSENFTSRKESNEQPYGVNMLTVDSGPGLFSKFFCHFFYIYGLKTYDYPKLTETVLNDDKLNEIFKIAAWEIANNDGFNEKQAMMNVKDKAKTILIQMESRISNTLLKITAWILYKLLPCFLRSAIIFPSQIEVLKKASDTGLPLIFLPLHRSHLDYVMISFILLMHNIRNPLIAAGDNLRIPFFGWLLRGLGAFFIKRRIDPSAGHKDILYRAVLHTYIIESLRAGHNIEFFVEGGRTRTGKPCMPKGGILSVIVDAYMDGIIDDALVVPIAMNYERLVDGNFVREQLGQPKKMETFGSTMKAIWSTLMGNYGIVKINFCEPFSLSKMLKSIQKIQNAVQTKHQMGNKILKHTMSNSSLYGTDFVAEEHRQLVDNIARHVVYDCFQSTPIMSTNIVALLLLNKFRDGCTLDELVKSFDVIKKKFRYKNVDMAFSGKTIDIINHALDILGSELVKQQQEEITEAVDGQLIKSNVIVIRPVSMLPNLIELSYYSNSMISYYIMESVAVTALYAELKSEKKDLMTLSSEGDIFSISEDHFIKRILKLCDILRYEFIFCKPCDTLDNAASNTIRNLSSIFVSDEITSSKELWTENFRRSSDGYYYEGTYVYKLKINPISIKIMDFLHSMLRPLIDTYTLSAYTLRKLVRRSLSEKVLLHEVLNEIKTNLDNGTINYAESLCVDPIKNSFKLFEKLNILECVPQGNVKIFYLKVDYDTDVAIENFYQDIAAFKWTRSTE